jgi:TonB-dependent SusC/RagA subfamily outer membrane receptor
MTPSFSPAALSVSVLIGLAAGCASANKSYEPVGRPMVTAEDIERNPGTPIEKLIESKVPGVVVSRTSDGGLAIQIRGGSSFDGSNEPLYVLNDSPITPGPDGALHGINPYDIESIRVLKDPADTGIYGMRGANGVVVIRLKQPGYRRD